MYNFLQQMLKVWIFYLIQDSVQETIQLRITL